MAEPLVDIEDVVRVLLIEDDAPVAEMYRMRLIADGYSVEIARSGEEGLRLAAETLPDLIYLDIRLPGMDGMKVLERLRASADTAAIPVVIVTNYGEPELRERGLKLGALEFLLKLETTPTPPADGRPDRDKTRRYRLNSASACGGGRGIRTPEGLAALAVFKTAPINHSGIPPGENQFATDWLRPVCSGPLVTRR